MSSWMSSSRHVLPLIVYSLSPLRNIRRPTVTSLYSMGRAPSVLSMVSRTSARPSGGRDGVPAKMTSDIVPPRSAFAPCSPSTHAIASTTLLLPEPFGPTTQVMPGSRCRVVELANDLKPRRVRLLRCTCLRSCRSGRGPLAPMDDQTPTIPPARRLIRRMGPWQHEGTFPTRRNVP